MNIYVPLHEELFGSLLPDDQSVRDSDGRLEILLLTSNRRRKRIYFEDFLAYRKLDEGDALLTLEEISRSSKLGYLVYVVKASRFLNWFAEENMGVRKETEIRHFCILTLNSVIDVISLSDPVVE